MIRLGVNMQGCNMFKCQAWGVGGECWGSTLFSCSVMFLFVTLQTAAWTLWLCGLHACQASLSFTISQSLLRFMSIDSVMPSNRLILCHPHFCQSFSASGSFLVSWLFTSGSQSIGAWASASAAVLSMYIQGWFPLALTGLISLQSKELSRVFSSTTTRRHQFFSSQPSLWSNSLIHTWLLEKPQFWLYGSLSAKWCLWF